VECSSSSVAAVAAAMDVPGEGAGEETYAMRLPRWRRNGAGGGAGGIVGDREGGGGR